MSKAGAVETELSRDPLTGLPGPEAVRARLAEWHDRPSDGGEPSVHALLLGLRRFDAVNLAYGESAGDAALAEVAARIVHFADDELDGSFLVARGGGRNFLVVANWACSRERWRLFAEQLADAIARPVAAPAGVLRLYPRIALLRAINAESAESMLDRLSQTLAIAEGQQGRRIAWADGEASPLGRTAAQLDTDLLAAIDGDQIEVVFQPQFSLEADRTDDRLTGAEALARWNHPELGRIGASALFAIAERSDHLAPISRHIARLALGAAAKWRGDLRLSLNVTATDLSAASFGEELIGMVAESGFPPERLTLEVTEQALLFDLALAQRTLRRLSSYGMRVALDDFGAGFCNFRYLKLLPLHYLKLDKSMIDGVAHDPRDLAVLRAIVAMARALDLKVIAEGIETEAQRACIAAEGCAFYQGFLKAQPMMAEEFLDFSSSRI